MAETSLDMDGASSAADRRVAERKRVTYRMDVLDASGELAGCVLDISSGGLRLACAEGLDVGRTSCLWIEFPRWMKLGDGLNLAGRFVWCRPGGSSGAEAGFSFDSPPKRQVKLLEDLIAKIEQATRDDRVA